MRWRKRKFAERMSFARWSEKIKGLTSRNKRNEIKNETQESNEKNYTLQKEILLKRMQFLDESEKWKTEVEE